MRWWLVPLPLIVLLGSGCARNTALRPGDIVRPEIAFAPEPPWPPEAAVAIGMLFRVERPGHQSRYVDDAQVREPFEVRARITFFDGDQSLGDPLEVPFVRDC